MGLQELFFYPIFRHMKKIKQKDVATEMGITSGHLSKVLRGRKRASPVLAIQIEKILGIPRANLRPDLWGNDPDEAA